LRDALRRLLRYPNMAVQSAVAWALRSLILITPNQIGQTLHLLKTDLEEELAILNENPALHGRICVGLAQGLAVLVQISPFRPLYHSTNVLSDVWSIAISLLQLSGKSELRISQVQIQAAWILISSLMSCGNQFIKSHLNKLLLLWQNALPRPISKDIMAGRSATETQYLLLLKERALAALGLFLRYNEKLMTLDLSKRIMTMLADTSAFVARIPPFPAPEETRNLSAHLQLNDSIYRVKAQIFQCYTSLLRCDRRNTASSEILMTAISIFAEADSSMSMSATTTRSTINTALESPTLPEDNFLWGITSYFKSLTIPGSDVRVEKPHWAICNSELCHIEDQVKT